MIISGIIKSMLKIISWLFTMIIVGLYSIFVFPLVVFITYFITMKEFKGSVNYALIPVRKVVEWTL